MSKFILRDRGEWKGEEFTSELYAIDNAEDIENISPIKQIHAVCFLDSSHIVLQKSTMGFLGLVGGHIETGESFEETLKREIMEEIAGEMKQCKLIGYEKTWYDKDPENTLAHFLRYWATVKLLNEPHNDPSKKSLGREIVSIENGFPEFLEKARWGKIQKALLDIALKETKTF